MVFSSLLVPIFMSLYFFKKYILELIERFSKIVVSFAHVDDQSQRGKVKVIRKTIT